MRPLSERVSAPAEVPVPTHPDIVVWRPATDADIDGIWRLRQAMGRVDHPNYLTTRDAIAADFAYSHFHAEQDSIVGLDASSRIVANGQVMFPPRQETLVRSLPIGGVHPEFRARGIGRVLLEWQLGRAKQQLASSQKTLPGWIIIHADGRAPQNARLFERGGLRLARYFLSLERLLAEPIRSVPPATGIRLAPYSSDLSAAVHAARDDAFMDHWGGQPMSDENWEAFVTSGRFAADLSFVAFGADPDDTERVVGFVLTTVNEDVWATQGFTGSYIDQVGVISGWRGRHIAQSLLATQLEAGRALGHERATLVVDSDSATGALGLYTGMGFQPVYRKLAFVLEF